MDCALCKLRATAVCILSSLLQDDNGFVYHSVWIVQW